MSNRYWVNEVQLGLLITSVSREERQAIIDLIIDKQFLEEK